MSGGEQMTRGGWARRSLGWLLLLLAGALAAVLGLTAPKPKRRPSKPRQPLVSALRLEAVEHCITIEAHGRVEPVNRIKLIPQVSGRVQRVHASFVPGGRIPAGKAAITIEDAEYRVALQQARADLKTADEELRLEKARHETAVAEWKQHPASRSAGAKQRDLATRGPQKRIREAAVERARAAVQRAELDLRRTRIRFSFPIVIETIAASVGSVARAGESLGVGYPLRVFWINVGVPVQHLKWLAAGRDAATVWPRGRGRPLKGTIREIRPDVEQRGSLGQLLVEVPIVGQAGEGRRLPIRAGEFVRVALRGECLKGVFALPRRAVRGGGRVWLVGDDGRVAIRSIAPLFVGKSRVVVKGGLRAGERVITSPLGRPVDGMKVQLAKPSQTRRARGEDPGAERGSDGAGARTAESR